MRLLGKRQLGELEISELVVTMLVANLASLPLQDTGLPLLHGLMSILILFCCELLVSGLSLRFIRLRELIFGRPVFLIRDGEIVQEGLRRCSFTLDELMEELRRQGILDLAKVQYAILETDGALNAILYPAEQAVTAAALGIELPVTGWPAVLISDGRVLSENLRRQGLDENWLKGELTRRGVRGAEEVYLLTRNDAGEIYFARRERLS